MAAFGVVPFLKAPPWSPCFAIVPLHFFSVARSRKVLVGPKCLVVCLVVDWVVLRCIGTLVSCLGCVWCVGGCVLYPDLYFWSMLYI